MKAQIRQKRFTEMQHANHTQWLYVIIVCACLHFAYQHT